jgi:hypothetical protein
MIERVEAFESGALHMDGMRADLETLLMALEDEPEPQWSDAYSGLCNELHVIWSIALAENSRVLTSEDVRRSREIAARLKQIGLPKIDRDVGSGGDC